LREGKRNIIQEKKSTKHGKPWKIVHKEELPSLAAARKREKYLKSGSGREFIKKILDS
jgi:putative endonuclease